MTVLNAISIVVGAAGVVVVVWGILRGAFSFLRCESINLGRRDATEVPLDTIRLNLGRYLLLGLEFLIAADIIRTIAEPTLEEVTVLAIIVAIRTVLSFFLTREMERVKK
jgi:uncharacterized membrane protein